MDDEWKDLKKKETDRRAYIGGIRGKTKQKEQGATVFGWLLCILLLLLLVFL